MATEHRLTATASPGGLLFTCEDDLCGRRLVIDRQTGEMTVIDHGDRAALHSGSIGGVVLATPDVT
ncbi:hypothetical protein [Paractinoplanes brasiliensis]|uniref:Uncharacterized protein n=1 Tax=Paractinoplanes brasiliensis TaxID=52695 RepID=A0A4R6J8B6_9ACTN|nr:hypothetical protein [Actinoplanes brasiliensis]TDO31820.1 hypothetical protein C8E87_7253 [Actinoplanes brasiliensis]GID30582.1 hypothetical protein Abr02nite_55650 [Actinoplanes brasiliensis]